MTGWDVLDGAHQALAGPLRAAAAEIVEPLRGFAYAPPLTAASGDDEVSALLRYLGRRPDWAE